MKKTLYPVPLLIRVDDKMRNNLRKLSFLREEPISQIVRECIEKRLEQEVKVLKNSDIMI